MIFFNNMNLGARLSDFFYKESNGRDGGRGGGGGGGRWTDRTNRPKRICLFNFSKVGGHNNA